MTQVAHDVEVIVQEQNPICWVASCAMVKGFWNEDEHRCRRFYRGLRSVE